MHDQKHGGPYDRGRADSYYRRAFKPHYYAEDRKLIKEQDMTLAEREAYEAGYSDNEESGDHKDYS